MYHSLISRALRVRRAYAKAHGRAPHLLRPRRFTEKIQWRKIFDFNPVFPTLGDKIAVREYIAGRIGREHLLPLLWSGAPAEISFDGIARPFFLKSTHSSGQVIMVGRDNVPDRAALRTRAESRLAINHGTAYDEPGYGPVLPRLMIEQTVTTADRARRAPRPRARSCSRRYLRCRYLLLDRRVDPLFMVGLLTLRSGRGGFRARLLLADTVARMAQHHRGIVPRAGLLPASGALKVTPSAADVAS